VPMSVCCANKGLSHLESRASAVTFPPTIGEEVDGA